MRIFTNLDEINNIPPTALALGKFDGVHLGHAELIRRMVGRARERGLAPAVFTFSNHPYNVIAGRTLIGSIAGESDKAKLLSSLGVEYLFSFRFDDGFHKMPPSEFIDGMLCRAFNVRDVFCGFNFRFGAEAGGDANALMAAGAEKGFDVEVMDPFRVGDTLVSSTVIRDLISDGSMEEAAAYLGRPFSIAGEIGRGNGIGRGLGFPTANIALTEGIVVPAYGVYVTESEITGEGSERGKKLRSVTNIGVRPTVGDSRLLVETHIFGVPDKDLYGHGIRVGFLSMVRPERKFANLSELKAQVERDKQAALEFRHSDAR
ncbi:MAG: bifunctional riboflavin kinase/FAD synthetase [Clostridiales Family XIII bacterium]|jgi:riboflavin kinase/FMN adenylyltransferase|nr:bifunctional riboflavin kinase/FAD synthetase [Clostridiales Family XIII bacterium]